MKWTETLFILLAVGALGLAACDGSHRQGSTRPTVATQADAKDLPRVIVKAFVAKGISDNEASTLAEQFCMDLSKANKFELFCPGDLDQLLKHKELQLSFGECQEEDCLSSVGEKINADLFVLGTISKVGDVYVVQVNLANGKTGKVQTRVSQQIETTKVEDLLPAMAQLADKVLAEM